MQCLQRFYFPRDVLDEIWDLIELVSEGFLTYSDCSPGPEVIKLFSCSTEESMKFQMLISIKISRKAAF